MNNPSAIVDEDGGQRSTTPCDGPFPSRSDLDPVGDPGAYDGQHEDWVEPSLYHASSRLSRTILTHAAYQSPAHAREAMLVHPVPSRAMIRGDAIHTAVLEPERFAREYAFPPVVDRRRKEGKAAWAEFMEEARGKKVVGFDQVENRIYHDDCDAVREISARINDHAVVDKMLRGDGLVEPTYAWDDEPSVDDTATIRLRCRPDRVNFTKKGTVLIDFKSTQDAGPEAWRYHVERYRLYFQAAFYMDGYQAATGDAPANFVHVVYETTPPYASAIYVLDDEFLQQGRKDYRRAIETVRACAQSGAWPDYADQVKVLKPSSWFIQRNS